MKTPISYNNKDLMKRPVKDDKELTYDEHKKAKEQESKGK